MRNELGGWQSFAVGILIGAALLVGGFYTLAYFSNQFGSTVEVVADGRR
ncbi:hypothetical protein [Phenylobacterium sp.]|nr:hypothetical protein [Phenylobacterium sp.]